MDTFHLLKMPLLRYSLFRNVENCCHLIKQVVYIFCKVREDANVKGLWEKKTCFHLSHIRDVY